MRANDDPIDADHLACEGAAERSQGGCAAGSSKGRSMLNARLGRSMRGARCAQALRCVLAVVLSVALVGFLGGCKDSDRLTDIIYDQDAEYVDVDNPTKIFVQDPSAEEETDLLPMVEPSDSPRTEQDEPEEPDSTEDEQTDPSPDENVVETQSPSVKVATNDEGGDVVTGTDGSGDYDESGTQSSEEDEEDADTEGGEEQDEEASGQGDDGGDTIGGESGARGGGTQTRFETVGAYQQVPTGVDYVAAFGEAATVVSMLAGDTGALLYTDAAWKSRDNLQTVLGSKYNADVKAVCTDDDSYSVSEDWLEAMIADSRLECVFLTSGKKTMTDDQVSRLEDAGIAVSYLPSFNTAANIMESVVWVGRVFAAGTNANTSALDLANQYVDFHNAILANAANIAGTSATSDGSAPVNSTKTQYYTLYVSDWADNVSYINQAAGIDLDTSNGIGITTLGYSWSPLAYYMSMAGVVNTASAGAGAATSGTALVWQFNCNHIPATESSFSRGGLVTNYQTSSGNTAYGWTYLCSSDFKGVGTPYFPMVVVSSQASKAKMEADKSSASQSLYKLYGRQTVSTGSVSYAWYGPLRSAAAGYVGMSVGGLVGEQSLDASMNQAEWDAVDYAVVVNPDSLIGESWTDGSVESVLETAWISYLYFPDSYDSSYVANTIAQFYSTFYGYSLSSSELSAILAGPEA